MLPDHTEKCPICQQEVPVRIKSTIGIIKRHRVSRPAQSGDDPKFVQNGVHSRRCTGAGKIIAIVKSIMES